MQDRMFHVIVLGGLALVGCGGAVRGDSIAGGDLPDAQQKGAASTDGSATAAGGSSARQGGGSGSVVHDGGYGSAFQDAALGSPAGQGDGLELPADRKS